MHLMPLSILYSLAVCCVTVSSHVAGAEVKVFVGQALTSPFGRGFDAVNRRVGRNLHGDNTSVTPQYFDATNSNMIMSVPSDAIAVVGALDATLWSAPGLASIAPVFVGLDELRSGVFGITHPTEHRVAAAFQDIFIDSPFPGSKLNFVVDDSEHCAEHMAPLIKRRAIVLSVPFAVLSANASFNVSTPTEAYFLCVANVTEEVAVLRRLITARAPAVRGAAAVLAPEEVEAILTRPFIASVLHCPRELANALAIAGAASTVADQIHGVTWLPAPLLNVTGAIEASDVVAQCAAALAAAGYPSLDVLAEPAVDGCIAAMIVASGIDILPTDALATASSAAAALVSSLYGLHSMLLPSNNAARPTIVGPWSSTCAVSTMPVYVTSAGSSPHQSTYDITTACGSPFDRMSEPALFTLVVLNTTASIEAASSLRQGMAARFAQSPKTPTAILYVVVNDPALRTSNDQLVLHHALTHAYTRAVITPVDVDADALAALDIAAIGAVHTDAMGPPRTRLAADVGLFGSLEDDIFLAMGYLEIADRATRQSTLVVSASPAIVAAVADRIDAAVGRFVRQRHLATKLTPGLVAEPLPTLPSAGTAVLLVVPNTPSTQYVAAALALLESASDLILIFPERLHTSRAVRTQINAWRATVTAQQRARLLLADDEILPSALPWSSAELFADPLLAKGYAAADMAVQVGAIAGPLEWKRAFAQARIYHVPTWTRLGLWDVEGLTDRSCMEGRTVVGVTDFAGVQRANDTVVGTKRSNASGRCECNRRTGRRVLINSRGVSVFTLLVDPCDLTEPPSPRFEMPAIVPPIVSVYLATLLVVCLSVATVMRVRASDAGSVSETSKSKSSASHSADSIATSSAAQQRLPLLYRVPSVIIMLIAFAIPLSFSLGVFIPMSDAVRERISDDETVLQVLDQAHACIRCVRAAIPVVHSAILTQTNPSSHGPALRLACDPVRTFSSAIETAVTRFFVEIDRIPALLVANDSTAVIDAALAASVALQPVAVKVLDLSGTSRRHVRIMNAAAVVMVVELARVSTSLLPLEQLRVIGDGLSTGTSLTAIKLSNNTANALDTFLATSLSIVSKIASARDVFPKALGFYDSVDMVELRTMARCIVDARDMVTGRLDFAAVVCVNEVLRADGKTTTTELGEVLEVVKTPADENTREVLLTLRDAVRESQAHLDASNNARSQLLVLGVSMLVIFVVFAVFTSLVFASAAVAFRRAFQESAALEAAISRYVPLPIMDLMGVASVHDMAGDPVDMELTVVYIDYGDVFAAACRNDRDEVVLLRRLASAVSTFLSEEGELEHLTAHSCCLLFRNPDAAVLAATDAEQTFYSQFATVGRRRTIVEGDVESSRGGDGDDTTNTHNEGDADMEDEAAGGDDAPPGGGGGRIEPGAIGVGVHRDTVALGFVSASTHTFGTVRGRGIHIARLLATACKPYGATILMTQDVVDVIDTRTLDIRDLGLVRTRLQGSLAVSELLLPVDRTELDTYKRESTIEFNLVSSIQQRASDPATPAELQDLVKAAQRCRLIASQYNVTDAALEVKASWDGARNGDDLTAAIDE